MNFDEIKKNLINLRFFAKGSALATAVGGIENQAFEFISKGLMEILERVEIEEKKQ
jgi:hypothetical protein